MTLCYLGRQMLRVRGGGEGAAWGVERVCVWGPGNGILSRLWGGHQASSDRVSSEGVEALWHHVAASPGGRWLRFPNWCPSKEPFESWRHDNSSSVQSSYSR